MTPTLLALLALACTGAPRAKAPDEAPLTPVAPEPQAAMPTAAFPPLPGWLAFSAQPRETRRWPWTPVHPNAKLVVFDPKGWDELDEGTAFVALSGAGALPVKYSELSYIPYGCDDVDTQMVAFQGTTDLPEEALWVLPGGTGAGAASLPVREVSRSADARTWSAGDFTVALRRDGPQEGTMTLSRGGRAVLEQPFSKHIMDGDEDIGPMAFDQDDEVGLPVPIAAFTLAAGMPPVLVIKTAGYEGVTFSVFTTDGGEGVAVGQQGLYLCAY